MSVTTADDYAFCTNCQRLRLRPPAGLCGTNDVACEVCREGYAVTAEPVTADALAWELHETRLELRDARESLAATTATLRFIRGDKA